MFLFRITPVVAALTIESAPMAASQGAAVPGYCVIDGSTFAATEAGIQAAINTASCKDIYVPAGNYSGGTVPLTIARSSLRLHGAGGSGDSYGPLGSTVLSFSCLPNAVIVGDVSPMFTYGGLSIEDLTIALPTGCAGAALDIKQSYAGISNVVRRVRLTGTSGKTAGSGVHLESYAVGWTFENVVVDHFHDGYLFDGWNHFVRVIGGQCMSNTICANARNTSAAQNITFAHVDIEDNDAYGFDIFSSQGFIIRDNYIDNTVNTNARAIRIGGSTGWVEGVTIVGNLFNCPGASYAIELGAGGFSGLHIHDNHFNSCAVGNVLNNAGASGHHGSYFANDNWYTGSGPELSSQVGFDFIN